MPGGFRVGVDVGGTFTKAVVVDGDGRVVGYASTPTRYNGALGAARSIVDAVSGALEAAGVNPRDVDLLAFTTTHNVNALLEGDTATVGLIVMARREHASKALEVTRMTGIEVAPGRRVKVIYRFVEVGPGFGERDAESLVRELAAAGAEAIAVNEAFGVEDPSREEMVAAKAREAGLPAVAGHELSMVYGLEVRVITSVVNASIMPRMARVARAVAEGCRRLGVESRIMVVKGDGGVAGLGVLERKPILTVLSGPAASVVGAVAWAGAWRGVLVEVGGTTTNVAVIKGGSAPLDYLKVMGYPTTVKVVDVEVLGVAGGSLPRVEGGRLAGVGPRSAHIAGAAYASFADPDDLAGGRVELASPLPGDPRSYLLLRGRSGRLYAVTPTCAAVALGAGSVPGARRDSALAALETLSQALGMEPMEAAARIAGYAAGEIARAARRAAAKHGLRLKGEVLLGAGGAAQALLPLVAERLGVGFRVLPEAPILSALGAAVGIVSESVEVGVPTGADPAALVRSAVERVVEAVVREGADPRSVVVHTESLPAGRGFRVTATGSLTPSALASRRGGGLEAAAEELGVEPGRLRVLADTGGYMVVGVERRLRLPWSRGRFSAAIVDSLGRVVARLGRADVVKGRPGDVLAEMERVLSKVAVAPEVYVITGNVMTDLSFIAVPEALYKALRGSLSGADGEEVVVVVGW
jgi:N-methylhydantoinase A/oxoprolinase/acetone carboxylase beta subunit